MRRLTLFSFALLPVLSMNAFAGAPQWMEVRSPHFSVVTDAGAGRGREAALRFEQMRAAFGSLMSKGRVSIPVPLQIVAFRSTKEMRQFVPLWKGKPVQLSGLFQGGEDRCFILLDMSVEDPWRVVFHEYGHQLLRGNISFETQPWFDEGFADFFSTIQATDKQAEVGKPIQDYYYVLSRNRLMKSVDFFNVQHNSAVYNESGDHRNMFYAQSWLMVHYIYDNELFAKLISYFNLTANHAPVEEAIQKGFGMTPTELDKALQRYFDNNQYRYYRVPIAAGPASSSYSATPMSQPDMKAVLADVHMHSPDYTQQAQQEFEEVLKLQPDNAAALRGLGYGALRQRDFEKAGEYFAKAAERDSNDPRVLYYSALLAQQMGAGWFKRDPQKLETVQRQLEKSISLDPDFADAYSVLSFVYMSRGKVDEAVTILLKAISLDPRHGQYSINLAQLYLMQRKYDDAIKVLQQVANSGQLPFSEVAAQQLSNAQSMKEMATSGHLVEFRVEEGTTAKTEPELVEADTEPPPASGPITFLKGKLQSVDCSGTPGAEILVVSGAKTWRLHVRNTQRAILIGADSFSCNWANQKVAVNFRQTGDARGDIVSLELQ